MKNLILFTLNIIIVKKTIKRWKKINDNELLNNHSNKSCWILMKKIKRNRICFSIRFLIFYDEFLTLFELMLISLYNLRNVNMKFFFDFIANMFCFFDKIWLIFKVMFKTIIKFAIYEKCNKLFSLRLYN